MSLTSQNIEPYLRISNLAEVVQNKCYRSEIGFADGVYWFRGERYSLSEINSLFPVDFIYSIDSPDKKNIAK